MKPYFLAYHPSYQSVNAAIVNMKKDIRISISFPERNKIKNTGDKIILKTLNVFGKFKLLIFEL